jgi:hypothetical protein
MTPTASMNSHPRSRAVSAADSNARAIIFLLELIEIFMGSFYRIVVKVIISLLDAILQTKSGTAPVGAVR